MATEQLFNVIKATPKADSVPDYLRGVTAKQIIAYFFNWHTDKTVATEAEIDKWFLEERGWSWELAKD